MLKRVYALKDTKGFNSLYSHLIIGFSVLLLLSPLISEGHWYYLEKYLLPVLGAGLTVMFLIKLARNLSLEMRLLLILAGWVLFTRLLFGDPISFNVYSAFVACCFFATGYMFDEEQREQFIGRFFTIIGGFLLLFSLLGIISAFTGIAFPSPFYTSLKISAAEQGLIDGGKLRYIQYFSANRNTSAAWFMAFFALLSYFIFHNNKKASILKYSIFSLLLHTMIALQHCRSAYIASSVCFAMFLMIIVMKSIPKRKILRLAAMVIVAVVGLAVCYKSFDLSTSFISTESIYEETRDFQEDASSLNGRLDIWAAITPVIKEEPKIAIFGGEITEVMELINEYGDFADPKHHMHNMFFQIFVISGLPGLLIYLAFCVTVLVKMIKVFFTNDEAASPADEKSLMLPIAGLFVYGLVEPLLFSSSYFSSCLFSLFAGLFCAYFPNVKRMRRNTTD